MARPLLPPRGVHIPARMIYHPQLPPAVIHTWIQLRGLAWGGTVTPPLRMQELTALTGKCQATLYSHMSLLRHMLALSWRSTEQGRIIVTFAKEPFKNNVLINSPAETPDSSTLDSSTLDSRILDSKILESKNHPSLSLNPLTDSDHSLNQEREKKQEIKDKGNKKEVVKREGDFKFQESGMNSENPESSDPVAIFRGLVHFLPNPPQRKQIAGRVSDPGLWRETVCHWLFHGWNPKNLSGMLDLYVRGGPSSCRGCREPQQFRPQAKTTLEASREAIEELRREMCDTPGQEDR